MPSSPTSKEQVDAARAAVLAIPSPHLAGLVATGSDRLSWLNGLVTCDLSQWGALHEREARYALVVTKSGRVLADPILVAAGERTIVVVDRTLVERLRAHLDHYLVMEDVEVAVDESFELWLLHGPRSEDVLAAARSAGAMGGLIDRTGFGGAIVLATSGQAGAIRAAVESSVRGANGVVGDGAGWEALRLERGVARIGVDFDEKTYPQEASLEKAAVSFNKGCYLGQEVVCMLEMRGHVKRKLVSLVFDSVTRADDPPLESGSTVADETGSEVGELTSASMSPTLEVPVGLAMVKRAQAREGARLVVAGAHAKVVARPT